MEAPAGWRVRLAAIVAATALLTSPAKAGCSLGDMVDTVGHVFSAISDCESACSEEASCAVAIWLAGVLTGVAAEGGQGMVNSFCSQAQGTADQIVGTLKTVGGSSIGQSLLGEVADKLESVGAAAKVVKCACETEQSGSSANSSFGACVEDALCWLQAEIFGDPCQCTPPPPKLANCAATNVACGKWNNPDPLCQGNDGTHPIFSTFNDCQSHWDAYYADTHDSVTQTTNQEGTLIVEMPAPVDHCGQALYCFCPQPMVPACVQTNRVGSDWTFYMFACACPEGTHPGATMPNGISSCFCDNTNEPAIFGFAPMGMCPPPACPPGQTRLGGAGDCVTPCSDPTQGMAFDGSCCDPRQMTSCGDCCPPDTLPDPKSGTCVPRPQPPK
jgi:hypothetical protein